MRNDDYEAAVAKLSSASSAYYLGVDTGMDDAEYDELARAVHSAEARNPEWITGTASSSLVGSAPRSGRPTHLHKHPMLSLDNVFSGEELDNWAKGLGDAEVEVEPKLDGIAISAIYLNGNLERLVTRGDGAVGEDVTKSPVRISGLPRVLSEPVDIEIRGEVCMTKTDFRRENAIRASEGSRQLSNPRNAAAGAMLATTGRREVEVSFWAYDSADLFGNLALPLDGLKELGVRVSLDLWRRRDNEEVTEAVSRLMTERASLPVSIDGAVLKVIAQSARRRLGSTSRSPRWAVAYKFPAELRRSRLLRIDLQVGRGGSITPVGRIEKVHVGGADVSSVNLHNPGDIRRKDLRVGDVVWVRRAGDVIPDIVGPDVSERSEYSVEWKPPVECPECEGPVDAAGARLRCANNCGTVRSLIYAAGRSALDIDGMGEEVVSAAYHSGMIQGVHSLYKLEEKMHELAVLKVGEKTLGESRARRIAAASLAARKLPTEKHLIALGVPGVGPSLSRALARSAGGVEGILASTEAELAKIEGVGPVTARSLKEFFTVNEEEIRMIAGIVAPEDAPDDAAATLAGKIFAVTGSFRASSRAEIEDEVVRRGGRISPKVTSRTDFLLRGEGGGSKIRDAERHGVTIISEEYFLTLNQDRQPEEK